MLLGRVVVLELFVRDQPLRGDDQRRGDEEAGEPEREPEQLRVRREAIEDVDDHERDCAARGREQQQARKQLRAGVPRRERDEPLPLAGPEPALPLPGQQEQSGDERVLRPTHA